MKIDVKHVAKLANLKLKSSDEQRFEKQLNEIVTYVEKLNEVDTKNVEITSQVTGLENVTREDAPAPSLTQEEVLSPARNALPEAAASLQAGSHSDAGGGTYNGLFKVNAILENES